MWAKKSSKENVKYKVIYDNVETGRQASLGDLSGSCCACAFPTSFSKPQLTLLLFQAEHNDRAWMGKLA